jgi:endonuclease/exonuclease/phosphatase family metal-dependent hydrolase
VAVRVWANDWLQEQPLGSLVVVGDLNDGPDAATTQILYGPPDQSLKTPDKGDPWRLNLARFLPSPDTAFSRLYHGRGELIDHILASTNLARRNVEIAIDTTHVTSIGDQPSRRRRAVWPDHAPVGASIT